VGSEMCIRDRVTTTSDLASGVGYSVRQLRNLIESKNLIHKQSVIEDAELGKKISLTSRGGPKTKIFWTIEGMTFVAMFLNSATADQFRTEVLRTVKELEAKGFISMAEVASKLQNLETMPAQQAHSIALTEKIIARQEDELTTLKAVTSDEASAAGKLLAASKKTKHLRIVGS